MRLSRLPKCPRCSKEVDIRPALLHYASKMGRMRRGQGVRCRSCHTVLAVNSSKTLLFLVPLILAMASAFLPLEPTIRLYLYGVLFVVGIAALIVGSVFVHSFCRLELPPFNKSLQSDDKLWDEAYEKEMIRETIKTNAETEQWEKDVAARAGIPWVCAGCSETNPVEIFACWNCGRMADHVDE